MAESLINHKDDLVVDSREITRNHIYCVKVCLSYLTELGGGASSSAGSVQGMLTASASGISYGVRIGARGRLPSSERSASSGLLDKFTTASGSVFFPRAAYASRPTLLRLGRPLAACASSPLGPLDDPHRLE